MYRSKKTTSLAQVYAACAGVLVLAAGGLWYWTQLPDDSGRSETAPPTKRSAPLLRSDFDLDPEPLPPRESPIDKLREENQELRDQIEITDAIGGKD